MNEGEFRTRTLAVLEDALRLSEPFTHAPLSVANGLTPRVAVSLLGCRARRALLAVRSLLPLELDDQIYVLSRPLIEAAIDSHYIACDTERLRKPTRGGPIPLTQRTKADLFFTHHDIVGARMFADGAYPATEDLARARHTGGRSNLAA